MYVKSLFPTTVARFEDNGADSFYETMRVYESKCADCVNLSCRPHLNEASVFAPKPTPQPVTLMHCSTILLQELPYLLVGLSVIFLTPPKGRPMVQKWNIFGKLPKITIFAYA